MAVTPEQVFDLSVKHRIALNRYSTHLVQKVIAQLNRVELAAVAKLAEAASDSLTAIRLEQLLTQIRAIQSAGWVIIGERVTTGLQGLADSEAAFAARLIGVGQETAFTGAPAFAQVYAAVQARPFSGKLLRTWLQDAEEGAAKRVRETIRQGFIDGTTTDQIVRQLRGTKAAGYQDGILQGTRRGVEAMVRTAVTHTANVAHDQVFKANADIVNALRWTSVLDGRTTMICISRSGKEYPVDSGPRPPAHINCLIADSHVATGTRITSVFKRWYDGDVVVIRTAAGKELTSTPNHPILTDRGWVAAGLLNEGCNVVCDTGIKRMGLINPDCENVEARIEDVAEAFFANQEMATMPVPTAAEDFHGDGIDGEVAVIATNRFLNDRVEAALNEHSGQAALGFGNMGSTDLSSKRSLSALFFRRGAAPYSLMSILRQTLSFFGRRPVHSSLLLSGPVARGDALFTEIPQDGACCTSEVLSNAAYADALVEHGQDDSRVQINGSQAIRSELESGPGHSAADNIRADADLARDLLNGNAGEVTLDQIASVQVRKFAGHVFNLETEGGWYVAENIITHNCRSVMVPVVDDIPGVAPFTPPTYEAWLKKQPAAFQDEVLGAARGALFRRGGLSVDRFIDRAGHTLTLDQLRQRDASAFKSAGL